MFQSFAATLRLARGELRQPRMKIGKVTILRELGTGAGSRVYLIRRARDEQEYALKMIACGNPLKLKYLEQLRTEYRLGKMLDHPNLIKVYALETDGGWFTSPKNARLLTEYAAGQTMDQLPVLPPAKLLRVFERIAAGLSHMHQKGIIHADVKPNNIILGSRCMVKLIDYGIAQLEEEPRENLHGTREFMAPETGIRKLVNQLTDIYGFGATMYRLATFRLPPSALTAVILGEREFERQYIDVGEYNKMVPRELADLIRWCLSYRPECRPRSMEEVRTVLARLARITEWNQGVE
jgi:serine/threonine-protein kinase